MDMHMLNIDAVEWVEAPGHVDNYRIVGDLATVSNKLKEMQDTRSKSISFYIEYCCDTCRKAIEGGK